jgi:hypothetical protein|tara:strand:- start:1372 stop:1995 length:624 start_codon:yes stop_codon:yes gene_type:complete
MASLRNVSSETQYVGGWQGKQCPPGQVIRIPLAPGGEVVIPDEVIHSPEVRRLAETADFKLVDVALVAGGPVEADPELKKGQAQLIRKVYSFGTFANDNTPTRSIPLDFLPSGSMISSVVLRLNATFDDGAGVGATLELGSSADVNALMISEDIGVAPTRIAPTPVLTTDEYIASGYQLRALFTADSGNLDAMTAGLIEILVSYFVC